MIKGKSFHRLKILFISLLLLSCQQEVKFLRPTIDLSGEWQFALDTNDVGIREKWFSNMLDDIVKLPGTTDLNKKGFLNHDTTTLHLNRVYKYEGPAWYRKEFEIPSELTGKQFQLVLERTKHTKVWVDDNYIGESFILQSPQVYDLSNNLTSGVHSITLRVNNNLKLTPYGNVHIYSDDTQTNWNGIIGKIFVQTLSEIFISNMQVYPNIKEKSIHTRFNISNSSEYESIEVIFRLKTKTGSRVNEKSFTQRLKENVEEFAIDIPLGENIYLWDEYEQPLYELTAELKRDIILDSKTVTFGIREFISAGKQFTINGRKTFLRGKNDACVFPVTGHPPMEKDGWLKVFNIAKSYGINHYRFHSYCPPEAAFKAADAAGIFLQPELPFWGGLESDTIASKLKDEALAMLTNYGNHPSFVMFGPGNEIWSGHDRVEEIVTELKALDNRMLFTMGANNNIGYIEPRDYVEYFIGARTPFEHDTTLTHTRLTHAFSDSRDGGILNTETPSTLINYDFPVSQIDIPVISHEIGQYQIYPDYKEIEKYTGVLKAWNLEVFQNRLKKSGMFFQNVDFQKASGAWSAICYKAEMEAALRTKDLAGFQLLDLQDFPGQGTALVGILDAFMDSKNVISCESWLASCNDVVLLLEFPKYCWSNEEIFEAELKITNYSNISIQDDIEFEVTQNDGKVINSQIIENVEIEKTGLNSICRFKVSLNDVVNPSRLNMRVKLKSNNYFNTYPIWVYNSNINIETNDICIAEKFDNAVISKLNDGKKVLLFPDFNSIEDKSISGLFPPDFWNYGMFKMISGWNNKPVSPGTLGILTDPLHPIFDNFPTEFHTNWQWFNIIKSSRPLILNNIDKEYKPIVQIIDNLERNNKLGLIFEFAVGRGKLLVCMSDLQKNLDQLEVKQLYQSILAYMRSDNFSPKYDVDKKILLEIL